MSDSIEEQLDAITLKSSSHPDQLSSLLTLLSSLLSPSPSPPPLQPLISFPLYFLTHAGGTQSHIPNALAREGLEAFVLAMGAGVGGLDWGFFRPFDASKAPTATSTSSDPFSPPPNLNLNEQQSSLYSLAARAFHDDNPAENEEGFERRKEVVVGVLEGAGGGGGGGGGWGEEYISALKFIHSSLLEHEESFDEAARVLMGMSLEGGSRTVTDEQKLNVYMKIVRLFLETGESGLAQTYFSRAAALIHVTTDKSTRLAYKLSQARLFDFSRRFNEAAGKYHELSFVQDIDEEERIYMLSAAVTCAILGPAGPQRSRILANLYRDDRILTSLPSHRSSILRKMFLDQILRVEEIKEFEKELAPHQMAQLEVDKRILIASAGEVGSGSGGRKGPFNVLDRAVMEHNVLACVKVYDNISFEGLGALLDLTPNAAEAMARTMIEQSRLRAWIDQVDRLIYFEGRNTQDQDDVQGTAGGLGVEKVEKPIQGITMTERWDERIKDTSMKVEAIANAIEHKGLLQHASEAVPMAVD